MKIGGMKGQAPLLWFIALLLLVGLACAQAGEVLTPAEATERARGPVVEAEESNVTGAEGLTVGSTALLTGRSFLINILDEPAGRIVANQERGAEVVVQDVVQVEGALWYQIEAPTGSGWVAADNLEPLEEEAPAEEEATGPAAGDQVTITGTSFLINILNEPNGRIVAGQERGATVTILEITEVDGESWFRIDAPGGEGWVKAENIVTEEP